MILSLYIDKGKTKMNIYLENFLEDFDDNSVEKGEELYNSDKVFTICKNKDLGVFTFSVKGNGDTYSTRINTEDNKITNYYCSCPYFSRGYNCKHLYASALVMRDLLDEDDNVIDEETSSKEENNLKSNKIRLKDQITQSDISYFKKTYATLNSIGEKDMIDFLDSFELTSDQLVILFNMIRKPTPLEAFMSYLDNNLDIDFFKKVDLSVFPKSFSLKEFGFFLLHHTSLLPYLSKTSLNVLFSENRISSNEVKSTLLFACISYDFKEGMKAFFDEVKNGLTFYQDIHLVDYLKKNFTKEDALYVLSTRIENHSLTRMEFAFIYNYFDENTKQNYEDFFSSNEYATTFEVYHMYGYNPYDEEYRFSLPMNSYFYNLLTSLPKDQLTSYDFKTLLYLRDYLFTSPDKEKFGKRFKTLANSLFRTNRPNEEKLYSLLRIFYEYADKVNYIKDSFYRLGKYPISTKTDNPELLYLYSLIGEKYSFDNEEIYHLYK